ncbi:MAG: tRNA lysidine(34) synthetase TilS [Thermodesulfobacteriota bacterium]
MTRNVIIAAVSGGPDSIYLLEGLVRREKRKIVVGHVNHGTRGPESEKDQALVEHLTKKYGLETRICRIEKCGSRKGFEDRARRARHGFLKGLSAGYGGAAVAMAHTADDQIETVLMRFLEGAGIAGLKGIPRETEDGIVRPILGEWKEDILKYLKRKRIPYRLDRSNLDTRFERNWIRHVLVPLLVERYGKQVKKRIFTLGERFREIDGYLENEANRWIRRNVKKGSGEPSVEFMINRKTYSIMPSLLRVRILQKACFEKLGLAPNERLLEAMDRSILTGKPSGRIKAGKGWELVNRYEEARLVKAESKAADALAGGLRTEERRNVTPAVAKRIAGRGNAEVFDAERLRLPLRVRPLRYGDRILPFGQEGEKKLKEVLIDRKIPREERWGRPAVCDSEGTILWVPGVIRSAHAAVTADTRYAKILSYFK